MLPQGCYSPQHSSTILLPGKVNVRGGTPPPPSTLKNFFEECEALSSPLANGRFPPLVSATQKRYNGFTQTPLPMSDYNTVETSPEVWAVIRARHPELVPFSTYSAPDGDYLGGNTSKGEMFTSYGFPGSDYPIMEARTTWDINPEERWKRNNEQHRYWLCLPIENQD